MGLFSKSKDENKGSMPPAPMPPAAMPVQSRLDSPPLEISRQAPILSAPPVPSRNSFDDIKSQVMSTPVKEQQSAPVSDEDMMGELGGSNDDSLFDFSTLDIPEPSESTSAYLPSSSSSTNAVALQNSRNALASSSSFVDTNEKNAEHLSFVTNRNKFGKGGVVDNLFVTTSQFKTFLEIVEQVRGRVKESSDRHLRLLDIKSEEDREYEALRKDFQYIEDKLYEVDSLIFDK